MTIVRNILDKRIKNFSDIQSFKQFDNKYIGETGYFSDSMCRFQDLNECTRDTLADICKDAEAGDYIFECECGNYRYFLPETLLKKLKKKYRPFSLEEFLDTFKIGDVVEFRQKGSTLTQHKMFAGYENKTDKSLDKEPGACDVILGIYLLTLEYLFNEYELLLNDEWQPFGIEEL